MILILNILAFFYWDPAKEIFPFDLPLLGRPLLWYGALFALGFLLGHSILLYLLRQEKLSHPKEIAEGITFSVILGAVIGGRLGDVIFYENWAHLAQDPFSILRVWEGGLASHGGVLGVFVALAWFLRKHPSFTWLRLLDWLVVPTGVVACCIRLGNFINQEVLGKVTTLPWAVIFGHPLDGSYPEPRHPVQLYEALYYFLSFFVFFFLYKHWKKRKEGQLAGLYLIYIFTFRFLIEFLKEEQSYWMSQGFLDMGQYLSLPLILLGFFLLFGKQK